MAAKITIVILNWNGRDDTLECLDSLNKISYQNYKIVLIDNGSSDGLAGRIKKETSYKHIKLIENPVNRGFTGGNNQGINYAKGNGSEYVLLLNNDTVVDANFLTELVKVAKDNPQAGLIGPKLLLYYELGVIQFVGGKFNFFTGQALGIGWKERDREQYERIEENEWFTGCCWLVPTKVFDEVGLLDEDYFSGHEDVDFCWRLRKKGYKILYCPKAKVWHKVSRSMGGRFSPFNAYFLTRNKFIFASKHLNFLQKLFFLLYMYLVFPIRSLAYYLLNRSPGSLKGVYHAYVWHISGKQYYIDLPKPIKVVRVGSL